ncbi:MAG: sugar ABC transporter substrate-binding protein [Cyanobacteria bacterium SBLK]|nr:sugar ABC transporter substrate-binding protein [Cyanobacteria bacterium SBLK]
MKPFHLSLSVLAGLLLSVSVGCGSRPAADDAGEIEFWTMQLQPKFNDYFNDLIAEFETENPGVTVRWIDVPWSAMESKILTAVSAKTAPDVVNLNPVFASQLATRNVWADLDTQISPEARSQYLPNIWQASILNDKSFGIPWYLTTQIVIYNRSLLQEAGLDKSPSTYIELADMAKRVKETTGKYGFFVSFVPEDSGEILESLIKMGVRLLDEEGKAAFNTPEGKAAFQYWVNLYQNELLPPEVLTQGHRYAIELYQAGETALLTTGAQFFPTIENNAPDIATVSDIGLQITGETGKKNVAVMNLVIPRETDKPEDALKFALFVTNSANQLAFAKEANVLPSTHDSVQKYIRELNDKTEPSPLDRASKVGAQQLNEAEVLLPAMDNLKALQKAIYSNLQAAMLGEKSVDRALEDAAKEWNALASRNQ